MKNLFFYGGMCFLLMILFSCESDIIENYENVPTKSSDILDEAYFVNENGSLVFNTIDDYFALSDSIVKLSDDEYEEWSNKNHFYSYRQYVQNMLSNAVDLDEQEQLSLSHSMPDFIQIDNHGFLSPTIQSQIYRSLINKERIFYIGKVKHVVNKDVIEISTEGGSEIQRINYCDIYQNNSKLKSSDIIEYPLIEAISKDGNRKIFTWFKLYKNMASGGVIIKENIILDIMVRPRKFVYMIGYKDYNEKCMVEELKIHMPGIGVTYYLDETGTWVNGNNNIMFLKTVTSKAASLFTSSYILNGMSMSSSVGKLQDPICIHYRARIGDMGKDGAAYNTYHPMPGMNKDDCGHRLVTPYQHVTY